MRQILRKPEAVPALLLVLAFVAGVIESPKFLDVPYLLDSTSLYAETGLLTLGMTLVIVAGQIDLSVASMMALIACVTAKLLSDGLSLGLCVPIALCFGALLGAGNGVFIAYLRLPSFVVTLGTMALYRGAAQGMLGAKSEKIPSNLVGVDYVKLPGTPIPLPLVILVLAAIVVGLVLHQTVFGRWIFASGTNERAARFAGVPTERVKVLVFAISGLCAAAGGLLIDSRLGIARYDHGLGWELDAITAVVLGGASIFGGEGSILGSILALAIIGVLRTGMNLANVSSDTQLALLGTLLVAAIVAANVRRNRLAKTEARTNAA